MKRDMDLIRKMLLAIEEVPTGYASGTVDIEGYEEDVIGYHAYLLADASLIDGTETTTNASTGPEVMINHLTWAGHEFIDAARDESRWQQAKKITREKAGSIPFDVLKGLLIKLATASVGF